MARRTITLYSGEWHSSHLKKAGFCVVGGHFGDVLNVWPNEVVQQVQVGGGGGPVGEGYKVVAHLLKPSLGLFRLVGRRRVLLPHPGSATGHLIAPGDHHTPDTLWLHQGITTSRYTLMLTFKPTTKMWCGMMWPSLETTPKTITVAGNFVFVTLGTSLLLVAIQICILRVLAMVLLS